MPAFEPAAIATCCSNGPLGNEMTAVFTGAVVRREASGPARSCSSRSSSVVLLRGARVLRSPARAQLVDLARAASRSRDFACVEPADVAVDVAERPRDALGGDLERPQHGRAGALHAVERARVGDAEGDRSGARARRARGRATTTRRSTALRALRADGWTRPGALDRRAQDRHAARCGCEARA